ncbi:MAG: ATP synthase F0 subunit B [Desulfovibrionaceae bacterium]|nr:ATP synthase F0 subunit B [Desulfovibrionaceae bacterium]
MLDLNITMLFQLVNFLITIFVLNQLLIKPLRKVMRERKEMMASLATDAQASEDKATSSLDDYESQLTKARQDAASNRDSGRTAGVKEQQALLEEAQKKAQGILGEERKRLHAEAESSLQELRSKVGAYSQQLAARVLNG